MSSRILPEFDLMLPQSVAEAIALLDKYQERITVLSGGTDVLVMLKGTFRTQYVLSLAEIPGLDALEYDTVQGLRIGPRTTIAQLLESAAVRTHYPALWQACEIFATPQIRNTATALGNLLRASPAGDFSCAVYATGAWLVLEGPAGRREIDIDDFWLSYGKTARRPNELAVELRLAPTGAGVRTAFHRVTRVNDDLAKLNVAVRLDLAGGVCTSARLAMGCVGPTPLRLKQCETLLTGQPITAELLGEVQRMVASEITPIDDRRSTADYRRQVSGVFARRVIEQACAGG